MNNTAQTKACKSCRGLGTDPMSDVVNWLPCTTCKGTGFAPHGVNQEEPVDYAFKTVGIMVAGGSTADRLLIFHNLLDHLKEMGYAIDARMAGEPHESVPGKFSDPIKVKVSVA